MSKRRYLFFFSLVSVGIVLIMPWLGLAVDDHISDLRIKPKRLLRRIETLGEYGATKQGGVNRVAFSPEDIQAREYLKELMREAKLKVKVDAAGNIIGRRDGQNSQLPPIMFGSHADTVPNGGKYDGALGVLAAIECAQVLEEEQVFTRHPLEVVVFADEEGGLIGSRALVGELTPEALDIVSHSGKTIHEGIMAIGGYPDRLSELVRQEGNVKAFVEIHVEQGGVLEAKGVDIGVVEGIVGINWWDVIVEGFANHAGTTPMDQRQDAMLAAAQFVLAVNEVVRKEPGRQVGTVGRIRAEPGVPNVIPGRVILSLELRDLEAEKIHALFRCIQEEAKRIENHTRTKISFSPIDATAVPTPTDPTISQAIAESARELGLSSLVMPSGAGHDAQEMARIAPIGMIFIPSVGGISHSPQEFSRPKDLVNGANVLLHAVLKIDRQENLD